MGQWLVCRSSFCLFYSNETSGAGKTELFVDGENSTEPQGL